jgi:hypothetical protein
MISKGHAKDNYLLNDNDLKGLKFTVKPCVNSFHDMKLYLVSDVRKRSIEKYSSLDNMESLKLERTVKRMNKKTSTKKKIVLFEEPKQIYDPISVEIQKQKSMSLF